MRRSKIKNFSQFVWAVKHREKFLTEEWERPVYECISDQAREMAVLSGRYAYSTTIAIPERFRREEGKG